MSTLTCPAATPPTSRPPDAARPSRSSRAMTRCECAGLSFAEIADHVAREGVSLDEVARKTGCGGTCTACIPDLRQYLARR